MSKNYILAILKRADNGKITFVASDETLDRGNEVIPIDSWDLKNFKKNPVLLVNHDYKVENIVGLAKNIRIENNQMLFDPEFHEITQLSKDVKEMVEQEVLNSVSVGFMPKGPKKDGDKASNELFEISFVPVPANPSAIRLEAVMAKSIDDIVKNEVSDWVTKGVNPVEDEEIDKKPKEPKKEVKTYTTEEMGDLLNENLQLKEGRVISGKNRTVMTNAITSLKDTIAVLEDLLEKAEPIKNGKDDEENKKGRDPKEECGRLKDAVVIRALQQINRSTNGLLSELK